MAPALAGAQGASPRPNVDFVQGPVLAPLRVMGIGGAFAGYAEGVDAIAANAAAVAVRPPYSTTWFDFDFSVGLSFPATFQGADFDNNGKVDGTYDRFVLLTLGGSMQLGAFGAGMLADFQQYQLRPTSGAAAPSKLVATLGRLHAVSGYSFFGGQLTVGGGLRVVTMSVDAATSLRGTNVFSMAGAAPEIGFLIRPDYEPWRIGFTYRAPASARLAGPPADVGVGFDAPESVRLPWEIEAGFALQAGPRPLNPHWINPHGQLQALQRDIETTRAARKAAAEAELASLRDPELAATRAQELDQQERTARAIEDDRLVHAEDVLLAERRARYRNWPRPRITVVGEVLLSGSSDNSVSLPSFLAGTPARSGESVSWSPRLGLEGEPVIDRLQVRTGTYIEPARIEASVARQHFTFGFDVRLGAWNLFGLAPDQIWRITGLMDFAPLYQNLGLSIGAWH